MSGPGPVERRLSSRLHYRVFGCWPRAVVHERLSRPMPGSENVKAIMREVYEQAGRPVPPEYR